MGKVKVEVIEAKNLAVADLNGFSDPYVLLKTDIGRKKTKFIPKTLNPVWNETLEIEFRDSPILKIEVYDHDTVSSDDPIGKFEINLENWVKERTVDEWWEIPPVKKYGEIHLAITPIDFGEFWFRYFDLPLSELITKENEMDSFKTSKKNKQIPWLIEKTAERLLSNNNIKQEGILRLSGSRKEALELRDKLERGKSVSFVGIDLNTVADLFKQFTRQCPDLFPKKMDDLKSLDPKDPLFILKVKSKTMTLPNFPTLKEVFHVLNETSKHFESNKMNISNILTIFGMALKFAAECGNVFGAWISDFSQIFEFQMGEIVSVKYSGDSKFYQAKILDFDPLQNRYYVSFPEFKNSFQWTNPSDLRK